MLSLHPDRGDGAERTGRPSRRPGQRTVCCSTGCLRRWYPRLAAHDSDRLGVLQQGEITGVFCETSCVFPEVNLARWTGSCPAAFQESCPVMPGLLLRMPVLRNRGRLNSRLKPAEQSRQSASRVRP